MEILHITLLWTLVLLGLSLDCISHWKLHKIARALYFTVVLVGTYSLILTLTLTLTLALSLTLTLTVTLTLIGGKAIVGGVFTAIVRRMISIHVLMFVALVGALIGYLTLRLRLRLTLTLTLTPNSTLNPYLNRNPNSYRILGCFNRWRVV
jgi:serine/threonine-protein kinase ATR